MKLFNIFCFTVVIFLSAVSASAQTPAWPSEMFKVKLLSDTYEDVVKRLGTPVDGSVQPEHMETFELANGELLVILTKERCVSPEGLYRGIYDYAWDVPEHVVQYMGFRWNRGNPARFTFKNMNLDTERFEVAYESGGFTSYYDERSGAAYGVLDGYISQISLWVTKERSRKFRCELSK